MIVCSCNVLSDKDVRAQAGSGPGCPRTPAEVYRCLGGRPCCGRCAPTIRAILQEASTGPLPPCGGCDAAAGAAAVMLTLAGPMPEPRVA